MISQSTLIGNRYEILESIGAGGSGEVYKALDTKLHRHVALKVLKSEFSNDKAFVERFRNEALAAANLSHLNIVSVFDVGEDDGYHYIVMELVEGITLKDFIKKKGKLLTRDAIAIGIQIAMGLNAAHEQGIIHRDIKPQNIMISRDGKVKVADFGIAKIASSVTYTQTTVGTAHYFSPEQAQGHFSDMRSDIYSFGITLYEMLTGEVPFDGDTEVAVALKQIQEVPKNVRSLVPDVPYSVDRVVAKCLQKNPMYRYQNALELISDLKRTLVNPDGDFVDITEDIDFTGRPTRTFSQSEIDEINTASEPEKKPRKAAPSQNKILRKEYEELDSFDSRFEMVVTILVIVLFIGLTIGVVFAVVKFFNLPGFFSKGQTTTPAISTEITPPVSPTAEPAVLMIRMPKLVGLQFEDAQNLMKAKSPEFRVVEKESKYSVQDKGIVIEQYPPEDAEINTSFEIQLTISAGKKPIVVPTVYGLTESAAKSQLEAAGFVVTILTEPNDSIQEGYAMRTSLSVGDSAFQGDSIILYVSSGRAVTFVEVPAIAERSREVAMEVLRGFGLNLGDVVTDYSDTVPYGYIISQGTEAGKLVATGTGIDVVISCGPVPEHIHQGIAGSGREFYDFSIDTHGMSDLVLLDDLYASWVYFKLIKDGYEYTVFIDYELPEDDQGFEMTSSSFERIINFRLYKDFESFDENGEMYTVYNGLTDGSAELVGWCDGYIFNSWNVELTTEIE